MNGLQTIASDQYPWHGPAWACIDSYQQADRMPHALLLWGQRGLGKKAFALKLAKKLLCREQALSACDNCQSCHWFEHGTHPDFIHIEPAEGKKIITVDSIRQVVAKLCESSVLEQGFVVVIRLCEQMNTAAFNALLKVLEEPLSARFILVSERLYQLPQTIKSRCQAVFLNPATLAQTKQYIEQLGLEPSLAPLLEGSPLLANDYVEGNFQENRERLFQQLLAVCEGRECPLVFSDWLQRQDISKFCALLLSLFQDILMIKRLSGALRLTNSDKLDYLKVVAAYLSQDKIIAIIDKLLELANVLASNRPINQGLWLDDLVIAMTQYREIQ